MKAGPTDRFLCSISTCSWYFDTPALPTTAEVNRSFQVGVAQALSERARGIDNVLREHFETHTVVEWMTEVNQRQRRATKAEAKLERSRETVAAQSEVIDELRARLAEIAEPERQWGSRIHGPDGWVGDNVDQGSETAARAAVEYLNDKHLPSHLWAVLVTREAWRAEGEWREVAHD